MPLAFNPSEHEPSVKNTVLEEALATIKQRQESYGSPAMNFAVIAELLADLGFARYRTPSSDEVGKVEADDIATIMIAVKLAREWEKHKRDNLVDIAGYVACDAVVKGDD